MSHAIAIYEEELKQNPRNTVTLNDLGVALCQMQQHEQGIFVFTKAVEYEPGDAESHFNLGNAYPMIGDIRSAIDALTRAIYLNPHDNDTLDLYAQAADLLDSSVHEVTGAKMPPTAPIANVIPELVRYTDGLPASPPVETINNKRRIAAQNPVRTHTEHS